MRGTRLRNFAYVTVSALGVGLMLYLAARYVLAALLPFVIGWAIAFGVRPVAAFVHRKTRIPERPLRAALALIITLGILALAGVGIWQLSRELWRLFSNIGEGEGIEDVIGGLTEEGGWLGSILSRLGDTVGEAVYQLVLSLLESLGRLISAFVSALPRAFLFIVVTVIASVYFSLDIDRINGFVKDLMSPRARARLSGFKSSFLSVAARYLRSYLILMIITFFTMLCGMLILRMPYALLIALLLALLDLLPIFGVGTALVPWCIYEFVLGTPSVGIGLIVLYVTHTVIRQFAEPKILGKSLGIHPIVTLLFIYVGYSLFGFVGILIGPLCTVLFECAVNKKNTAEVCEPATREGAPPEAES